MELEALCSRENSKRGGRETEKEMTDGRLRTGNGLLQTPIILLVSVGYRILNIDHDPTES